MFGNVKLIVLSLWKQKENENIATHKNSFKNRVSI